MSILKAATIPAILALLITGVGWLFDRSIQRFEKVLFLEYSTKIKKTRDATVFRINLANRSAVTPITPFNMLVTCPQNQPCLMEKAVPAGGNRFVTYTAMPPIVVTWKVVDDTRSSASELTVSELPVGAKARFNYSIDPKGAKPQIFFLLPAATNSNISVFSGFSAAAWAADNYYKLLLLALLALLVSIALYFIWLFTSSMRQKDHEEKPTVYRLVHSIDTDLKPLA